MARRRRSFSDDDIIESYEEYIDQIKKSLDDLYKWTLDNPPPPAPIVPKDPEETREAIYYPVELPPDTSSLKSKRVRFDLRDRRYSYTPPNERAESAEDRWKRPLKLSTHAPYTGQEVKQKMRKLDLNAPATPPAIPAGDTETFRLQLLKKRHSHSDPNAVEENEEKPKPQPINMSIFHRFGRRVQRFFRKRRYSADDVDRYGRKEDRVALLKAGETEEDDYRE